MKKMILIVGLFALSVIGVLLVRNIFFDKKDMSFEQVLDRNLDEKDTVRNLMYYRSYLCDQLNDYNVDVTEESFDQKKSTARTILAVSNEKDIAGYVDYTIEVVFINGNVDNKIVTIAGDLDKWFDKKASDYIDEDTYNHIMKQLDFDITLEDIDKKVELLEKDYSNRWVYSEKGEYQIDLVQKAKPVANAPTTEYDFIYKISLK